jgi:iron complex outermembrane receptor protein
LPQSDVGVANFEQELDSIAVFAQGTYHFSDKLSGTAGLRWTKDEKTASFVQVLNNPFAAAIRIPESSPNLAFDDSKMTWLANLNYQFDDTLLGFFNMATGFKSGGFNSQGAATDISDRRAFDSETTENIELGIKSSWLDDDLTANITFYRTDITDFQDRSFDGLSFLTSNAGELRQQGVEVDFKANLNDSFRIFGGFSFLDSKFLDYQNASPLPGGVGTQNLTGRPNHRAPRWQGNLTIDWSMPLGDNLDLFVRPSYSYVSEANLGGDTNLNPQTVQAGYGLLSLRTGVEDFASGWRLEAYVDNATDKGYCGGMFDQPFGAQLGAVNAANNTTVIRCVVGSPRTYGIKFSYSY